MQPPDGQSGDPRVKEATIDKHPTPPASCGQNVPVSLVPMRCPKNRMRLTIEAARLDYQPIDPISYWKRQASFVPAFFTITACGPFVPSFSWYSTSSP